MRCVEWKLFFKLSSAISFPGVRTCVFDDATLLEDQIFFAMEIRSRPTTAIIDEKFLSRRCTQIDPLEIVLSYILFNLQNFVARWEIA